MLKLKGFCRERELILLPRARILEPSRARHGAVMGPWRRQRSVRLELRRLPPPPQFAQKRREGFGRRRCDVRAGFAGVAASPHSWKHLSLRQGAARIPSTAYKPYIDVRHMNTTVISMACIIMVLLAGVLLCRQCVCSRPEPLRHVAPRLRRSGDSAQRDQKCPETTETFGLERETFG